MKKISDYSIYFELRNSLNCIQSSSNNKSLYFIEGFIIRFIASSEERNESLLSFRPSDDATKVEYRAARRASGRTKRVPTIPRGNREEPLLGNYYCFFKDSFIFNTIICNNFNMKLAHTRYACE